MIEFSLPRLLAPLLILALASMAPAEQAPVRCLAPSTFNGNLSILTFNVKGLPWPVAWGRTSAARKIGDKLASLCGSTDRPNLVVMQEAFGNSGAEIAARSGYRYMARGPSAQMAVKARATSRDLNFLAGSSAALGEGLGKLLDSGLMILSDYPLRNIRREGFPDFACAGFDCLANKGTLLVEITLPGSSQRIELADVHMNSKGSSGAPPPRHLAAYRRQLGLMTQFLHRERNSDLPLVFAGDFNPGTVEARRAALFSSGMNLSVQNDGLHTLARSARLPGGGQEAIDHGADWQFYFDGRDEAAVPVSGSVPFPRDANGNGLSDHSGYVVTYSLSPLREEIPDRLVTAGSSLLHGETRRAR